MIETILTQTVRMRDWDGHTIAPGRYVWRGPATDPVFALENCRDVTSAGVDVMCERPCEAIAVIERTRRTPGTIPSTMHGFARWRVRGNGLAKRGMWCRPTIDENNDHMEFHANWFAGVARPFVFEGQQSKHHRLTHNVIEHFDVAVSSDSAFHWQGGTIAVGALAFRLTRAGDPVTIEGVGVEATRRLLESSGPTTASQPVTLIGVRYEADQLDADGDCIVMRHAGPLTLQGCRFGGGKQRIPRITLLGTGEQIATIRGNAFGSFGSHRICPVRASNPGNAKVDWGRNTYQRDELDPQNTESRTEWAPKFYAAR